ncbi:CD99 antigen-like protein 2 isoform X2 [Narcine bancroftii]|uniref:CD99 antigen-like protein 2 isoform X2 n=1 Tax=Narcine bancroftii TaxID=1343680 RepID=UPI0038319117
MLLLRSFLFACLLCLVTAYGDSYEFDLSDALEDDATQPQGQDDFDLDQAFSENPHDAAGDSDGFDLNDALEDDATQPQGQDDFDLNQAFSENPHDAADDSDGFDLNDALADDATQPQDTHHDFDLSDAFSEDTTQSPGADFDDSDLQYVIDNGYKPDKTNSKGGTSEQFKKICFSILEMLNDLYNTQQEQ